MTPEAVSATRFLSCSFDDALLFLIVLSSQLNIEYELYQRELAIAFVE